MKNLMMKILKFFEMADEEYSIAKNHYDMDMDMHVWY